MSGLTLLALALGLLRASADSAAQPPNIATFGEGIELRVVGRIVRLPDSDNRRPLTLEIQSAVPRDSADLNGEAATLPKVGARLHVYSFSRAYSVGQTLQATGTLRLYDRAPTDPKRFPIGRLDRPLVEAKSGPDAGSQGLLGQLRRRLADAIAKALPGTSLSTALGNPARDQVRNPPATFERNERGRIDPFNRDFRLQHHSAGRS